MKDANERKRQNTDGETRVFRFGPCRPIQLTGRAVQVKLAHKIHGKQRSKKDVERLYEVLAQRSNILKVGLTTSTIKEHGKTVLTVRNSNITMFGILQEQQIPLKVHADRRGPQNCKKHIEERIQSHIKEFTRRIKSEKKIKHQIRDSSSRSNIAGAMRGRISKLPNSPAH